MKVNTKIKIEIGNKSLLKGIVESNLTNFVLLVVAIVVLVGVLMVLFPAVSKSMEGITNSVMKPFCCDMLKCKPAVEQATTDISGGLLCSALCWGKCG